MKLVQLNVWNFRLENQIYNFLKDQKANITCLQEAMSIEGDSGILGSVEKLQSVTGDKFMSFAPELSFNYMKRVFDCGNAVLSKNPILHENTMYTSLAYVRNFDFETDDYNIRNLLHVELDLNGNKLDVLTHHGYHVPNNKDGNLETMRQMKQIGEYIDTLDGSIILTGDFNLSPHSESIEVLNKRLKNLSSSHNLKTTRTNLTQKTEVCDYIFVNDKVRVKNFYASEEIVSDHKALILEFDV